MQTRGPVLAFTLAVALIASGVSSRANAASAPQTGMQLADPATAPVSRWQDDLDRIDGQVRLALMVPADPRANYVAGRLDHLDVESAARHFAAARVAAPQEGVYLSALATVCLQRVQPALPECDGVDRLADWASRDRDNGLPQLWLAERARKRGDRDAMVAYIAQAARAPRFDDYYAPGIVLFWEYFKTAPITVEPAARAEAALNYGRTVPFGWTEATVRTCLDPTERTDALRAACLDLGSSMLERGSSLLARRNGTFLIERNAADPAVRQKATAARAGLDLDNGRCDPGFEITPGLESADPAVRARAIASADAWVRAIGASGEAAACARRLAASR